MIGGVYVFLAASKKALRAVVDDSNGIIAGWQLRYAKWRRYLVTSVDTNIHPSNHQNFVECDNAIYETKKGLFIGSSR